MIPHSLVCFDSLKNKEADAAALEWSVIVTEFGLIPNPNLFCGMDIIDAVGCN